MTSIDKSSLMRFGYRALRKLAKVALILRVDQEKQRVPVSAVTSVPYSQLCVRTGRRGQQMNASSNSAVLRESVAGVEGVSAGDRGETRWSVAKRICQVKRQEYKIERTFGIDTECPVFPTLERHFFNNALEANLVNFLTESCGAD